MQARAQRIKQVRLWSKVRRRMGICLDRWAFTMKKRAPRRAHPTQTAYTRMPPYLPSVRSALPSTKRTEMPATVKTRPITSSLRAFCLRKSHPMSMAQTLHTQQQT